MSTATEHTVHGKFEEIAGKVKQGLGEATNDGELANKGAAQQVKGHAEQAWGSVKAAAAETIDKVKARHEEDMAKTEAKTGEAGHDLRDTITSTAQNVKEHIQHAVNK
jgi:uncharacterized protein YjbJ (UPF0337 family)